MRDRRRHRPLPPRRAARRREPPHRRLPRPLVTGRAGEPPRPALPHRAGGRRLRPTTGRSPRPPATAAIRSARAGSSGHPQAPDSVAADDTARAAPPAAAPSLAVGTGEGDWGRAVGLARHGSAARRRPRRVASALPASGHRPQPGPSPVHTVAPRSNIVWLNSHDVPAGRAGHPTPGLQRQRRPRDTAGQDPDARWCRRRPRRHRTRRTAQREPCRGRRRAGHAGPRRRAGSVPPCSATTTVAARCRLSARRLYPSPDHRRTTSAAPARAQAAGVGKRGQEALVVGHDAVRLRLLQHHLARPGSPTGRGCGARGGPGGSPPPTRARRRRNGGAAERERSVPDVVAVGTAARRRVGRLPHHQLAPEVADLFAALVEGLGLDGHDAPVVLRLRRRRRRAPASRRRWCRRGRWASGAAATRPRGWRCTSR